MPAAAGETRGFGERFSVAGHLFIQFFGGLALALLHRSGDPDARTFIFVASYAWVGVVALCT
jgi:hypothetical protein